MVTSSNKPYFYIIGGLLILAAAFSIYTQWMNQQLEGDYQAVFLTNNQVYFGKVVMETTGQLILTDVFYLEDSSALNSPAGGGEIALAKLGKELHAPQDRIKINKAQVLFVQSLGSTSRVADAINQYSAGR